jgi:hypothetical protein
MKTPEDEAFEDIERRQGGGFPAKRAMAADKLQEPVNLLEAKRIAAEYGTLDSQVDNGNLYFALRKCLEHIDAQPAQEPMQGSTSAVRTLQRLGYTDHGGELWKPPLGPAFARVQPVQEPVAWIRLSGRSILEACGHCTVYASEDMSNHSIPLYTTPSKREWVNLTTDQIYELIENSYFHTAWSSEIDMEMLVKNIDVALQKLNT